MTELDILRTHPDRRRGYEPQNISLTRLNPEGVLPRLKRIPHKITAYFHRHMIKAVYRSNHAPDPKDNYYIIVTNNDTFVHVEF